MNILKSELLASLLSGNVVSVLTSSCFGEGGWEILLLFSYSGEFFGGNGFQGLLILWKR